MGECVWFWLQYQVIGVQVEVVVVDQQVVYLYLFVYLCIVYVEVWQMLLYWIFLMQYFLLYQLCQQCGGYCFVVGGDFEQCVLVDVVVVVVCFFGVVIDYLFVVDYCYGQFGQVFVLDYGGDVGIEGGGCGGLCYCNWEYCQCCCVDVVLSLLCGFQQVYVMVNCVQCGDWKLVLQWYSGFGVLMLFCGLQFWFMVIMCCWLSMLYIVSFRCRLVGIGILYEMFMFRLQVQGVWLLLLCGECMNMCWDGIVVW